jgi:tetratricopeptide (TPR) repeat protein
MRFDLRHRVAWTWLAIASLGALGSGALSAEPRVEERPNAAEAADDEGPRARPADDDEGTPKEKQPAPPTEKSPQAESGEADDDPASANGPPADAKESDAPASSKPTETAESASPAIDATSLAGMQPGHTTRDALHSQWGKPQRAEKIAGGVRETYAIKAGGHVRVTIVENVVQSLATRLEQPVAVDAVAKQLEIDGLEPVDVTDEQGQLLGRAYPERGILLGFSPQSSPPAVFQIIIEPIDSQPFLARAEKRLPTRYADCLADVNQALKLMPDNGRAHWLQAELTLRAGALEAALRSAQKAVELEPKEPEYRLTLAKVLAETGDFPQAIEQARGVVDWGKAPSVIVARAHCLWGDYVAAAQEHDYQQAIDHHMQAIKLAEPLVNDQKLAVRRAAKDLLVDANLAVAHDVGWGRWQHKSKVVPKWIDRATAFADDILAREQGGQEVQLRVHEQALAALAGVADPPEALKSIDGATALGKKVFEGANDPAYKARVAWQLGIALNDAVEIETALHHWDQALAVGQTALAYFDQGEPAGKQLPAHDYLRGRLCYRLGAILAIRKSDHKQAVAWFEKAVPLLESPVPSAVIDCGKQGEIFVSMAVSYWDIKNHTEALRLTNQGVKLMEQAASDGLLTKTALAIPYGNLASMYEQLGDAQAAKKFSELAARHEETKSK